MSLAGLAALHLLDRSGALRINVLPELTLPMPAASRAITGLVSRGLVSRVEDASDRRAKLLALTDRGSELVDQLSISLVVEVSTVLSTADTPVSNRLAALFATMVGESLAESR